ncbi:MAG: TerC/Alx family metal homeostasis rane protein [Segetibacter sp.]|nr:TerC/Alx family metal homeostasis rane protein [Segetibacter sp.]
MTVDQVTYLTFGIVLLLSIVIDMGFLSKRNKSITLKSALYQSIFWVGLSIAFFVFLWFEQGEKVATKYITAYLMEKSLSIDNVFVFILIFSFFKVKESDAARALLIGVLLAIVFRIIFIALGIELINRFHWLLYIFGGFLLYTGVKLFFKSAEEEYNPGDTKIFKWFSTFFRISHLEPNGRYIIRSKGKVFFTTLFLVVMMLAATDIVFAVDSIPTVVSLVKDRAEDPFTADDKLVIYSSNIFAVLGLRSLFFLLRGAVNKFDYLQQGIAVVLIFIGVKMLIEYFDIHISIYISLAIIVASLTFSIIYSQYKTRKGTPPEVNDGSI